jgi:hypothetical protein
MKLVNNSLMSDPLSMSIAEDSSQIVPSDQELERLGLPKVSSEDIKRLNGQLLSRQSGVLKMRYTDDIISVREIKNFILSQEYRPQVIEAFINFKIGQLREQSSKKIYLFSHEHLDMNEELWADFKDEL